LDVTVVAPPLDTSGALLLQGISALETIIAGVPSVGADFQFGVSTFGGTGFGAGGDTGGFAFGVSPFGGDSGFGQGSVTTTTPYSADFACRLNMLQIEAVDHFMATNWVSAARILAQCITIPAWTFADSNMTFDNAAYTFDGGFLGKTGPLDFKIADLGARIAKAQLIVNSGKNPATQPFFSQLLNALQMELVDYYMNTAQIPAAYILATMTGFQSAPFNYVSNYTYYSSCTG
jgi:hypothetical protein